ncbi:ribbon-helix-helix protein, CopG family [cf. Phormidesmis sp. LEGE 11477]|nr:ribbon-helix-helix protein, CopG family [cf. Phormidesmis sp. LEGE 11477]
MNKKTLISLQLSDAELELLNRLSETKGMSKSAVIRQALRLSGLIESRVESGEKFYFESKDKEKSELVLM